MCGRAGDECGRKGLEEGGQRELVNIPSLQTHPCPLWLWSGGSEATYHPTAEEAKVHEMTPFNLKLEESQEPELFPSCKSTVPQEVSSSLTYPSLPPSSLVHASFYQRARLNLCFSVLSQQPCLVQESYRPLFFFSLSFHKSRTPVFPKENPTSSLTEKTAHEAEGRGLRPGSVRSQRGVVRARASPTGSRFRPRGTHLTKRSLGAPVWCWFRGVTSCIALRHPSKDPGLVTVWILEHRVPKGLSLLPSLARRL